LYQEDLNRYDRMAEDARSGHDNKILIAIEAARRAVAQRACGKGAEDALIADAMIKMRDQDASTRSQKIAAAKRRKEEWKSFELSRAEALEEQKRLGAVRARLRIAAEAQSREQESLEAARAYDAQDFVPKVGQMGASLKNRWGAMQRVLLVSKALPFAFQRTFSRDWSKWDSTNMHDLYTFPTPESYGNHYKRWLLELLAHLAADRPKEVGRWWLKEMAVKVPPADLIVPALPADLLTSATYLIGPAPAPPE